MIKISYHKIFRWMIFIFLKEAAPEARGQRFAAAAEHTEGPWDTGQGVADGGKHHSWEELLGTGLCFLILQPWCQGASRILLPRSCGQEICCPIPGRNKLQNINLCSCKGALTLEWAHQVFKEPGDNAVPWRRARVTPFWCMEPPCSPAHKEPLLCMHFTGLWLFVIKWDKQHFYGQRVVFCSSSATICSCGASQPLGCCIWSYHWSSLQTASLAPLCTCLLSN